MCQPDRRPDADRGQHLRQPEIHEELPEQSAHVQLPARQPRDNTWTGTLTVLARSRHRYGKLSIKTRPQVTSNW
ncbi:hypothetical protein SDC9_209130 [bioreactor metagenome]|uniref:Uncharacterized protein n=1 Tax=bioreactor metagenome TaxID=1076179 RepID=A0A645JP81_9ZZZZ